MHSHLCQTGREDPCRYMDGNLHLAGNVMFKGDLRVLRGVGLNWVQIQ
jgi:hypothetical protein